MLASDPLREGQQQLPSPTRGARDPLRRPRRALVARWHSRCFRSPADGASVRPLFSSVGRPWSARSVAGRGRSAAGSARSALLALGLAVVALARPQQGSGAAEVEASGIDIVLAIDISGSMRALDFELDGKRANRLDAVKAVVRKFIEARPDDRLGMVVFAGPTLSREPTHPRPRLAHPDARASEDPGWSRTAPR